MVSVAPYTSPRQPSPPRGTRGRNLLLQDTHSSPRLRDSFSPCGCQPTANTCSAGPAVPEPCRAPRHPQSSQKETQACREEERQCQKGVGFPLSRGSEGTFSAIPVLIQERIPFKACLSLELLYQSRLTILADQKARRQLQVKCPEN